MRCRSLRPLWSKSAVRDKVLRWGAKYEAYPGQVRCAWQRPPLRGRHQDTMSKFPQQKWVLQWGAGSGDCVNFINYRMHVKHCYHGVPGMWHNSQTYLLWYSFNSILQMDPLSFFTESLLKRPEVTGTPNQVFFFAKECGTMVIKLIQTKTITALGTVTPGSTTLQ